MAGLEQPDAAFTALLFQEDVEEDSSSVDDSSYENLGGKQNEDKFSSGVHHFRHYRRRKTNKAPRKRTFVANMVKSPTILSETRESAARGVGAGSGSMTSQVPGGGLGGFGAPVVEGAAAPAQQSAPLQSQTIPMDLSLLPVVRPPVMLGTKVLQQQQPSAAAVRTQQLQQQQQQFAGAQAAAAVAAAAAAMASMQSAAPAANAAAPAASSLFTAAFQAAIQAALQQQVQQHGVAAVQNTFAAAASNVQAAQPLPRVASSPTIAQQQQQSAHAHASSSAHAAAPPASAPGPRAPAPGTTMAYGAPVPAAQPKFFDADLAAALAAYNADDDSAAPATLLGRAVTTKLDEPKAVLSRAVRTDMADAVPPAALQQQGSFGSRSAGSRPQSQSQLPQQFGSWGEAAPAGAAFSYDAAVSAAAVAAAAAVAPVPMLPQQLLGNDLYAYAGSAYPQQQQQQQQYLQPVRAQSGSSSAFQHQPQHQMVSSPMLGAPSENSAAPTRSSNSGGMVAAQALPLSYGSHGAAGSGASTRMLQGSQAALAGVPLALPRTQSTGSGNAAWAPAGSSLGSGRQQGSVQQALPTAHGVRQPPFSIELAGAGPGGAPASVTCTKLVSVGAYGAVYRARWAGKDVAVKVARSARPAGELSTADVLRSFEVEAAVLRGLAQGGQAGAHPNIVRALHAQVDHAAGSACIVQEYASFGTLSGYIHAAGAEDASAPASDLECAVLSRIAERKGLDLARLINALDARGLTDAALAADAAAPGAASQLHPNARLLRRYVVLLALLRDVAGSLGHLAGAALPNGASVVHRDVKPSNVLLGDEGAALLADFGVARVLPPRQQQQLSSLFDEWAQQQQQQQQPAQRAGAKRAQAEGWWAPLPTAASAPAPLAKRARTSEAPQLFAGAMSTPVGGFDIPTLGDAFGAEWLDLDALLAGDEPSANFMATGMGLPAPQQLQQQQQGVAGAAPEHAMHGTAHYAAPEDLAAGLAQQAGGTPAVAVGPAADVFSLGYCLWEALGGRRPWEGSHAAWVAHVVGRQGGRLPVPTAWAPRVRALLGRMWAAEPSLRPTAHEVAAVVEAELDAALGL